MKKILIFTMFCALCATGAGAAVRDGTAPGRKPASNNRTGVSSQKLISTNKNISARTTVLGATSRPTKAGNTKITNRAAAPDNATVSRTASRTNTTKRTTTGTDTGRTTRVIARAGETDVAAPTTTTPTPDASSAATAMSETRTGAQYEKCKAAYFTCMDQFCQLKNDTYRRCSCSDRVYDLGNALDTLQQAGEQLTTFTENLEVVGMTAAQASAMRTASEGENALTADASASKALLQAIMNSIRGEKTSVGGKYTSLNSVNLAFDTANAFGMTDSGQTIATYNGKNLYSAVYPSCRQAVKEDCNNASLQRAINAYLMAIEQDCNTVQAAIDTKQKTVKSAVREGSAMLDLARVENRKKHNSSDLVTCINEVEDAILSEEVCGKNYHRCLDNGEYIDIATGKPIAGVEQFYKLAELLTFSANVDAAHQKLSKIVNNRAFVQNFESRTKKFAADALDKCVEQADEVWAEYLDRALLAIYYAQRSKVDEIKQGCFDFISRCYSDVDTGPGAATKDLSTDNTVVLQPDRITLSSQMCQDYIASCDNMFDNNIIQDYVNNRKDTDVKTACRAVAKQCFDKFGGSGYQNFYYPYSGIFNSAAGDAIDWFTLYDRTSDTPTLKSECAKQLKQIESCSSDEMLESVFGGLDKFCVSQNQGNILDIRTGNQPCEIYAYGLKTNTTTDNGGKTDKINHRYTRPTGVATEIYNQIVDILSTQCMNVQGKFVELQNIPVKTYVADNICEFDKTDINKYASIQDIPIYKNILYKDGTGSNQCPHDYSLQVSTKSWGACLCFENGARTSQNGTLTKCTAPKDQNGDPLYNSILDQYCPNGYTIDDGTGKCTHKDTKITLDALPEGINKNTTSNTTNTQ